MPGITVRTLDIAGGQQLGGGQSWFTVDGEPVVLLGDRVAGHGLALHLAPVMAEGSSWISIDGIPVCREGHIATCGHATSGRSWFLIP